MILWLDPWVRKLGYALITQDLQIIDSGILLQKQVSPSREDQFQRMVQIMDFFEQIFKTQKIRIICMEKLFFTKFNQNNAEFVYGIRGILLAMALKYWIKIKEFTPIELKKYITGNGKAEKILVQKTIMKLYKLQELPEQRCCRCLRSSVSRYENQIRESLLSNKRKKERSAILSFYNLIIRYFLAFLEVLWALGCYFPSQSLGYPYEQAEIHYLHHLRLPWYYNSVQAVKTHEQH